ncbi:hypothetical protein QW060_06780 [Myroides ceti]|uniref:Uncharacterized protein n=1 Tax=Paenimyroides ceti TaxID=395087 RepID=A0ABT8CQN8_9FLAO|nr:hypothetical protein [Paenimyroides ceti]MDN3706834.1 hypothetical protein [Paenimyroides ceti]
MVQKYSINESYHNVFNKFYEVLYFYYWVYNSANTTVLISFSVDFVYISG